MDKESFNLGKELTRLVDVTLTMLGWALGASVLTWFFEGDWDHNFIILIATRFAMHLEANLAPEATQKGKTPDD